MSEKTYDNTNMSRSIKKSKDICVFYDTDDGQEWCNYWTKVMESSAVKLTIDRCDTYISEDQFASKVRSSKLLVILFTSNMLQFLQEHESHIHRLYKRTQIAYILCHTTKKDTVELSDVSGLEISGWKSFEASDDGIQNRSVVGDILELLENQRTKRTTRMRKFKIIPCEVHQPGENIAVVFRQETTDRVEVCLGSDETKYTAQKMNPYTYSLKIPSSCKTTGKTTFRVYTNNTYFGEHPLTITTPDLSSYQSPAFLSQILRVPAGNREALDRALVHVYEKSRPADDALESILGDFYKDSSSYRSEHELPTLLHFAAKNGLNDLCSLLLDTPGSLAAFQIENCHGYDPAELADKHGHTDLAEYLRTFVDVEATVNACDDMYMEMNGRSLYSNKHSLCIQRETAVFDEDHEDDYVTAIFSPQPTGLEVRSRRYSAPTLVTKRPPIPAPRNSLKDQISAEEFMGFSPQTGDKGKSATLGSCSAESDLIDIQNAFKNGEFTLTEAERLYQSWKSRNVSSSESIKERKKAMVELRNTYVTVFDHVQEKNKHKSIFRKLKKKLVKKKSQQNMNISMPTLRRDSSGSTYAILPFDRSSGSSSGSRTSGDSQASSLDISYPGSESDDLLEEDESSGENGVVQRRQSSTSSGSFEARKSMRIEFLETAKSLENFTPALPPRNYKRSPPVPGK